MFDVIAIQLRCLTPMAFIPCFLAIVLTGCNSSKAETNYPLQSDVCDYFDKSEELLNFQLWESLPDTKSAYLRLPEEYFLPYRRGRYRNTTLDGAVHFQIREADFGPVSRQFERYALKTNPRPKMLVLLSHRVNLTALYNNFFYGEVGNYKLDQNLPTNEDRFGLISAGKGISHYETYVNLSNNQITDLILCGRPELIISEAKNENCQHHITYKNIGVQFTYDSELLKNWSLYRQRIMKFMSCMSQEK